MSSQFGPLAPQSQPVSNQMASVFGFATELSMMLAALAGAVHVLGSAGNGAQPSLRNWPSDQLPHRPLGSIPC